MQVGCFAFCGLTPSDRPCERESAAGRRGQMGRDHAEKEETTPRQLTCCAPLSCFPREPGRIETRIGAPDSRGERRHLTAHLVALERRVDPEFRRELTRKIDDHSPSRWLTVEEAESRLLE